MDNASLELEFNTFSTGNIFEGRLDNELKI